MEFQEMKEWTKELMASFNEAKLTHLSIEYADFKLELAKEEKENAVSIMPNIVSNGMPASINGTFLAGTHTPGGHNTALQSGAEDKGAPTKTGKVITSPIVGTFYAAESPTAKPFVEVGSYVHKGDVVCVVEAMKLMNEVEAEVEGEVVEILVENEEMVEYNQPLIVLR